MKKILIILLFIFEVSFGQDAKYLYENYEFKNGEIAYMFGNNVKLREQPTTNSNVLSLLKIGEQIAIIQKSNTKMEFDGIQSPWYKVKTKNKVGFVLGSLISLDKVTNGNLTYLIAFKKDGQKLFLKTRISENGLDFKENIAHLLTREFSIKTIGNSGLESIKDIFKITYMAESCGVNGGGIYLFYDGTNLIKAIDYARVVDEDLYWFIEDYIFPNEEEGIEGKIVYKSRIGENKEPQTQWTESKVTRRVLEWNGKEINPKIKTQYASRNKN